MKKQVTINQHYVPQFYLNRFSSKNKKGKNCVDVLDIDLDKILLNQRVENVAFEKYFYDIDLEKYLKDVSSIRRVLIKMFLKMKFGVKFKLVQYKTLNVVENILADNESQISPIFNKLIENAEKYSKWERENCYIISNQEKEDISIYLAIQYLRTPKTRHTFEEVNTVVKAELIRELHYRETGEIFKLEDLIEEINSEDIKNQHLNTLFTDDTKKMADAFKSHTWVFYKNTTNVNFITSDSQINIKASKEETLMSYGGINSPGVIILFPISKKIILVMYKNDLKMHKYDRKLMIIDSPEIVDAYNTVAFLNCHRFLYGAEKELTQFKDYVKLHKKSSEPKIILANSTIPKKYK